MNSGNEASGCLVTGVAGFVGSHLAERLLALGHTVVGVDNFFSGFEENLTHLRDKPKFHFHERSVTEPDLLSDLKRSHPDVNYCFHLAAIVSVPYSMDHPEETLEINHQATIHLLGEAEEHGFKAFVFAGSAAEYGDDQRLPLREDYAGKGTFHPSPYGKSKYLSSDAVGRSPIGVALRCFNIFGPRQDPRSPYSGVISKFVDLALAGIQLTIFGDGLQTRDFIYVDDIVAAYLEAAGLLESGRMIPHGIYNAGTGQAITILELADAIFDATERPVGWVLLPERPGDIRHSVSSVEALKGVSGWAPRVSLHDGLRATVKWTRESTLQCRCVQDGT